MPLVRSNIETTDPLGENVTIRGSQRRSEWLWFFDADVHAPHLPLYVRFCGNSIWESGVSIARKNSRVFSLELVTAGNIAFTQGGVSQVVEPGGIFVLRKRCSHEYATGPAGFAHKRILSIDGELLDTLVERLNLSGVDVIRPHDGREFVRIVKSCARAHRVREPGFERRISELAFAALLYAGSEITAADYPRSVRLAIEFMQQNLGRLVTLEELAAAAGLSIPHFCRLFVRHVGAAPMKHFRALKIRHARELLLSTTARVKQVALMLGYENIGHFTRVFTRETGATPKALRGGGGKATGQADQPR